MSDYERIAQAISFIAGSARRQPSLAEVAQHVHLSPYHFQRLFSRWAGITPKRFLQVLTLEHAKRLLRGARPLLEVADSVGLSSGSRLYDHFVQLEAATPGDYKRHGAGMQIGYAVHATPFGEAFVAVTPRGVCSVRFVDADGVDVCLEELQRMWPHAVIGKDTQSTFPVAAAMRGAVSVDRPLSLYVPGTNFQTNVWRALLRIPSGSVATYSGIAAALGRPGAARAVGRAIGANPVAFLIPCHRVIRESGELAGYRWGETRKHAMLAWEAARDAIDGP